MGKIFLGIFHDEDVRSAVADSASATALRTAGGLGQLVPAWFR